MLWQLRRRLTDLEINVFLCPNINRIITLFRIRTSRWEISCQLSFIRRTTSLLALKLSTDDCSSVPYHIFTPLNSKNPCYLTHIQLNNDSFRWTWQANVSNWHLFTRILDFTNIGHIWSKCNELKRVPSYISYFSDTMRYDLAGPLCSFSTPISFSFGCSRPSEKIQNSNPLWWLTAKQALYNMIGLTFYRPTTGCDISLQEGEAIMRDKV